MSPLYQLALADVLEQLQGDVADKQLDALWHFQFAAQPLVVWHLDLVMPAGRLILQNSAW